ncbi:hypothetical protein SAMN04487770_102166 [Butyrivibrio sp. ob235]|uniref:DUF5722 domain-containing protein n=1 Tax=Butyrivibrio sp. ob235 TaxID=1761780 RepID=UPI0008C83FB2|nr:DUF5722 domain-containing protein [Butyrivibrio sp. ob235]SEK64727.1 hypothetical protein SAMN04487770_102166 [Butyrivibrio sp. ob235]
MKKPFKKLKEFIDNKILYSRKGTLAVLIGSVLAVLFVVGILLYTEGAFDKKEEVVVTTEEKPVTEVKETPKEKSYLDEDILKAITNSGDKVKRALGERPATVDVPDDQLAEYVKLDSCIIGESGGVEVKGSAEGIPTSDDKYYYLFDAAMYEDGLSTDAEPISKIYKDSEVTLKAALNKAAANSRLYRKFFIAVKKDDEFKPVSHASYITNPEAVASHNYGGLQHSSKKGLLVDPSHLDAVGDLGVNYATYNIPLNRLLATSAGGSVAYTYNGVTYYFNGAILHEYDYLFTTLNSKGVDVAAIILNNVSPSTFPEVTHPNARSGSTAPYYMFNASDEAGVNALAAIGSFLAERYSGSGHGNVAMWIIGNEVNARKEWNYMASTDLGTYAAAYARAFRVFYNAIKSNNAGAHVYISLDQQWDRNMKGNPDYDGRDLLDSFAASLRSYGDIGWGLAQHPYTVPLTDVAFWNGHKLVTDSADTSFITMKNIGVLTNYMSSEAMLYNGGVRSIILSEVGYTSTKGDALQAAAIAYAYSKVAANGNLHAIMFSRQTDAPEEIAHDGLAMGLCTTGGGHKLSYDVFKYMDTPQREEHIAFARDIVGVNF